MNLSRIIKTPLLRLLAAVMALSVALPSMAQTQSEDLHEALEPLYFVNQYWKDYQLVRVGLSGLPLTDHYELGRRIRETAEVLDRRIVIIASGDLSHRLKADGPYG